MGKTYKRYPTGYHRCPRGKKRALINHCRPGAIPPDSYDDLPVCKLAFRPFNIACQLYDDGWTKEDIRKTLKNKFNLKDYEIFDILDWL